MEARKLGLERLGASSAGKEQEKRISQVGKEREEQLTQVAMVGSQEGRRETQGGPPVINSESQNFL